MANDAQIEHWNSDEARHWVADEDRYNRMLAPFSKRLLDAARIASSERVLDIGCGCGSTTLAAAQQASLGTSVGVDISGPMLEVARRNAADQGIANVSFLQADAQTHRFPTDSFDVLMSRFGVMFFDDRRAAFANLAAALAPGGRLVFMCWQDLAHNEFILVPGAAVAAHVTLPEQAPGAPGMFALADPEDTRSVLADAGFARVEIEPVEEQILIGGGGTVDDAVAFLRQGGMARAVLDGVDAPTEKRAVAAVTDALKPFATNEGVRVGAAAWLVSAARQ